MERLVTLLAVSLLYAGSSNATEALERFVTKPGIVLATGIAGFQVDQPVPGLLEKIGPLLDAAGTEELRVAAVATEAGKADPVERRASPERAIRLVQFIRGLEVRNCSVGIVLHNSPTTSRSPSASAPSAPCSSGSSMPLASITSSCINSVSAQPRAR